MPKTSAIIVLMRLDFLSAIRGTNRCGRAKLGIGVLSPKNFLGIYPGTSTLKFLSSSGASPRFMKVRGGTTGRM